MDKILITEEVEELTSMIGEYVIQLDDKHNYAHKHSVELKTGKVCKYVYDSPNMSIVYDIIDKPIDATIYFNQPELFELDKRFTDGYNIWYLSFKDSDAKLQLSTGTIIRWRLIYNKPCITEVDNSNRMSTDDAKVDDLKAVSTELGMKFDDDKLLCMAFPAMEYKQIIEVLTIGAKKYKIDNWKHVKDGRVRYMNGLERHFLDYKEAIQTGNDELKFDNGEGGMGTNHLANLICNAIFLLYFDNNNID